MQANDDILSKIALEMKNEYFKAINIEIHQDSDPKIGYSDLTVWFYNRDCQSALSEIKRIWETVDSNKLGTKSL